jgi:hypothetical protein
MTRYEYLLIAYSNLNHVYAGLIMVGLWVGGFGHLLDWITKGGGKFAKYLYWGTIVAAYIFWLAFILIKFNNA